MSNVPQLGMPIFPDVNQEAPKVKNSLGKDDFLKLLMTQLQHQDPINPMNHEQFATQLAQFSSLEQLSNIGSGIQNLKSGMGDGSKLQALGMIGRRVQTSGNEVELHAGQPLTLRFLATEGVKPVKASIFDMSNKLIREMEITRHEDSNSVQWDGRNQEGADVPPGKYTYRVAGVGKNGQAQDVGTELSGRVTGVEMDSQTPVLIVQTASGSQKVEWMKVKHVSMDAEPVAGALPQAMAPIAAPKAPALSIDPEQVEAALAQLEDGEEPQAVQAPEAQEPVAVPMELAQEDEGDGFDSGHTTPLFQGAVR